MNRLALLVLACCANPPPPALLSSHVEPMATPAKRVMILRALGIDGLAIRATWTIAIDGDRATLEVVREQSSDPTLLADIDRARWILSEDPAPLERTRLEHVGDHVVLDFASLQLRCWERPITVAPAGAVLRHDASCEQPVWNTRERVHVTIWACGFGEALDDGQRQGLDGTTGSLDETLFRFAPAPGIEVVEADCVKGIRLAK